MKGKNCKILFFLLPAINRIMTESNQWFLNTLRTGRQYIGFWLLNVVDRAPIIWLLGHAMLQHTIPCYGAMQTDKLCIV
jgi:hypothetical protein